MSNVINLKDTGKKAKPVKKYYDEWTVPAFTAFAINDDVAALQKEVGSLLEQAYLGGLRIGAERVSADLRPRLERIQTNLKMDGPKAALLILGCAMDYLKSISGDAVKT